MPELLELINLDDTEGSNMPYTPAVKVIGGHPIYLAGVTAAPVYHSHPHVPAEFANIPLDPAAQAEMAMDNLEMVLAAAGTRLDNLVEVTRFVVDIERNQDAINRVLGRRMGAHRPATTTVEVTQLATDPRLVLELKAVAVTPVG